MKEGIYIYSFYRFKYIKKIKFLKNNLDKFSSDRMIFGTILIANEGINGTISGTRNDLNEFISYIRSLLQIRKLSIKISKNHFIPQFYFKFIVDKSF